MNFSSMSSILNRLQKNSKQRNFRSAVLGSDPPVNTAKTRRKKRPIEDITTNVTRVDMEEVSSSPRCWVDYVLLRTCLAIINMCSIVAKEIFSEFERLLSSEKNFPAY